MHDIAKYLLKRLRTEAERTTPVHFDEHCSPEVCYLVRRSVLPSVIGLLACEMVRRYLAGMHTLLVNPADRAE